MSSFTLPASAVSSSGSGGGFWSGVAGLFSGGGGGSSSGMWGNIFQGLLGGLGSMASGGGGGGGGNGLSAEQQVGMIWHQGEEVRKNAGYAAQLADYAQQKDKVRRRAALDNYGQFSLLKRYAPNYQQPAPVDLPPKPAWT